ncbi:MAG: ABC transporter permease, partial [Clostridia bacterium]|nr:ABC transporter permease [Clostridia bacterium]
MKNTLRQVFHSPKFVIGFTIMMLILAMVIVYPLFNPGDPLQMIGLGNFFKPGIYVSVYDSVYTKPNTMKLPDAAQKRLESKLSSEDRVSMMNWLIAVGVPEKDISLQDTDKLLKQWNEHYDPTMRPEGMTKAQRNYYKRLDENLKTMLTTEKVIIADKNTGTGATT